MTGYTVHTGSSEKFTEGWDNIFSGTKKKAGKSATKKIEKNKSTKKHAKKKSTRKNGGNK